MDCDKHCKRCGKKANFQTTKTPIHFFCSNSCFEEIKLNVPVTLFEIVEGKYFMGKTPVKPTFIVAYGPPASGKSTTIKNLYKNPDVYRIRQDEVIDIDVDGIMKMIPGYEEERLSKQTVEQRQALFSNIQGFLFFPGFPIKSRQIMVSFTLFH